jgi:hypothetical protein
MNKNKENPRINKTIIIIQNKKVQNIQINTTPDTGGANTIGMGSKISQIKPQRKKPKTRCPISPNQLPASLC